MNLIKTTTLYLLIACAAASCIAQRNKKKLGNNDNLSLMLDSSSVLKSSFSGLHLFDLTEKKNLYSRNAERYFTPASNTKLFTLFACLATLGDSIPALKYVVRSDSLIFWGTADPTFLHPQFVANQTLDFLRKNSNKKLYFSDGNFTNKALGSGWMWDDYNSAFQPELSSFPMYGNIVRFSVKESNVNIEPSIFQNTFFKGNIAETEVIRAINENRFFVNSNQLEATDYRQNIPFKTSSGLIQQLLIDTLKQNINIIHFPIIENTQTLYSLPVDTVYRRMMQVSDNMLAEHLLLACGTTLTDTVNSQKTIELIIQKHLQDLPDKPKWIDGSGLSRYNLFTPRSMVALLNKMHQLIPEERLFSLMAIGGKTGTLKGMYMADAKPPFIFAKSGTISGVYNQSGYLKARSGKVLLFSFMNNNFNQSPNLVRKEVERILTWVHENY